nr:glycosyl hydrolase 108 family protein [Pararoseomonas indoligenes]
MTDGVIGREGRYSNHPSDKGGETMWGITVARARAAGYMGPMIAMPRQTAVDIYALFYIRQPGFDLIDDVLPDLGAKLIDIGVNMGTAVAGRFLQRALNHLNGRASLYSDLVVDGACGAMTRAALASLIQKRGKADANRVLVAMVTAQQSVRYVEITEANPTQEDFAWGWQLSRVAAPN